MVQSGTIKLSVLAVESINISARYHNG